MRRRPAGRAVQVAESLASVRAEGLTPSPAVQDDLSAYVRGELSLAEVQARVLTRYGLTRE